MKIVITDTAERQIAATSDYIEREWGRTYKIKFRQRLQKTISLLRQNPNLGAVEPLLTQYTKQFRSIVATSHNKIIYSITANHIEIVAFWDVRREPAKLASEVINNKEIRSK